MKTLKASYRIVTPMFIGDAEQKAIDLRPPAIKGALRFWWRALNWKKCLQDKGESAKALQQLHEQERKLFGMAARDEGNRQVGGQGYFILRVSQQTGMRKEIRWPTNHTGSGYLGFGLMPSGNVKRGNYRPHREAIAEGSQFTLSFIFKPNTPQSYVDSLKETLEVWGLFGGIGSRARNGFGSISLTSADDDLEKYCKKINNLLDNYHELDTYPPYSAFSQYTRFEIIQASVQDSARDSHNKAGQAYKRYRGYPESQLNIQEKIPLGLPVKGLDDEKVRRSSPLLFHVHPLKNNHFITGVLYLPAEFHPLYPPPRNNLTEFYRPVSEFMDSLK